MRIVLQHTFNQKNVHLFNEKYVGKYDFRLYYNHFYVEDYITLNRLPCMPQKRVEAEKCCVTAKLQLHYALLCVCVNVEDRAEQTATETE